MAAERKASGSDSDKEIDEMDIDVFVDSWVPYHGSPSYSGGETSAKELPNLTIIANCLMVL